MSQPLFTVTNVQRSSFPAFCGYVQTVILNGYDCMQIWSVRIKANVIHHAMRVRQELIAHACALDTRGRKQVNVTEQCNVADKWVILFSHCEINFADVWNVEVRPAISTNPNPIPNRKLSLLEMAKNSITRSSATLPETGQNHSLHNYAECWETKPKDLSSNPIQSNPMSITEAGQGLYFRLFLKFKIQKHK